MRRLAFVLALFAFGAAGCDGDHHDDGGCGLEANCTPDLLTYQAGLTVAGDSGMLKVRLLSVSPMPLTAEMENTWTFEVLDAQDQPVTGAMLTKFNTWSIDCGHFGIEGMDGLDLTGTDNGDGTFTVKFHWAHGGPWEARIEVAGAGATDRVDVGFCLPQTDHEHTHG